MSENALLENLLSLCTESWQLREALEGALGVISILCESTELDDELIKHVAFSGIRTRALVGACWYRLEIIDYIMRRHPARPVDEYRDEQRRLAALAQRALEAKGAWLVRENEWRARMAGQQP